MVTDHCMSPSTCFNHEVPIIGKDELGHTNGGQAREPTSVRIQQWLIAAQHQELEMDRFSGGTGKLPLAS